ncbi:putative N-acetyltransferase YhdJ [Trichoplax sp. H2]|nr:putative N-acetyltransferase YhdJ [Trichoplax sp. H2]|eukprot:RDD37496.1 putative N-acetyltransferase YhdJ [Trichoplax sp. H2]
MEVVAIKEPQDIIKCFDAYKELRPHLVDAESFVNQVIQQQKEGYTICAIFDQDDPNAAAAVIGYRDMTTLAWGKCIYIDDLSTRSVHRQKGYGSTLLQHVNKLAKHQGYAMLHLDTGYTRHDAHRVYLRNGFQFSYHHLSLQY